MICYRFVTHTNLQHIPRDNSPEGVADRQVNCPGPGGHSTCDPRKSAKLCHTHMTSCVVPGKTLIFNAFPHCHDVMSGPWEGELSDVIVFILTVKSRHLLICCSFAFWCLDKCERDVTGKLPGTYFRQGNLKDDATLPLETWRHCPPGAGWSL